MRIREPKISIYVGSYSKYGIINLLVNNDFLELVNLLNIDLQSPITKLMTEYIGPNIKDRKYKENSVGPLFYLGQDICESKVSVVAELLLECANEINYIANEIPDVYKIEALLTLALCMYYAHEDLKEITTF